MRENRYDGKVTSRRTRNDTSLSFRFVFQKTMIQDERKRDRDQERLDVITKTVRWTVCVSWTHVRLSFQVSRRFFSWEIRKCSQREGIRKLPRTSRDVNLRVCQSNCSLLTCQSIRWTFRRTSNFYSVCVKDMKSKAESAESDKLCCSLSV